MAEPASWRLSGVEDQVGCALLGNDPHLAHLAARPDVRLADTSFVEPGDGVAGVLDVQRGTNLSSNGVFGSGFQYTDGSIERWINTTAAESMSATDARPLAALPVEVADEMYRFNRRPDAAVRPPRRFASPSHQRRSALVRSISSASKCKVCPAELIREALQKAKGDR